MPDITNAPREQGKLNRFKNEAKVHKDVDISRSLQVRSLEMM